MSFADQVAIAWRRAPAEVKVMVDLRRPNGASGSARAEAIIVPASGAPADDFEARTAVRQRARRLVLRAAELGTFTPQANDEVIWGGTTYSVLAATPAPEAAPVIWRLTVER